MAFPPFFQREETGEAGRAVAGPIVGGKVAESGVERTIDGSRGLQGMCRYLRKTFSQSDKAEHFAERGRAGRGIIDDFTVNGNCKQCNVAMYAVCLRDACNIILSLTLLLNQHDILYLLSQ